MPPLPVTLACGPYDRTEGTAHWAHPARGHRPALIAGSNLAWVTGDLGDRDQEGTLHEAILRLARELRNERMEATALAHLALMVRDEGRLGDAMTMIREAIRIEHRRGNILEIAVNFGRLASILALMGRASRAHSTPGLPPEA